MSNKDPDVFNESDEDPAANVGDDSYAPPDQPLGAQSYGTTSAEELRGEDFEARNRHTNAEFEDEDLAENSDEVGRLVQGGDEDVDEVDIDETMGARDSGDNDDETAEEAAMHITEL